MNWTTYNNAGAALSQSLTDMPVGTITGYAGATAPSGWLLCDGSAVSRTTYAELFGVVSTTYGSGDGSTTFNVPDSSGFIILASSQAARLAAAALPQYVTSLPSSPVDGQTVVYAADASNGVMWTLRYRAASSSSYKWECVGGSGLLGYDSTTTGRTVSFGSVTWGSWSPTVSVTPPLAGEYVAEHQARVYLNGSAGAMAVGLGKTPSGGSLTEATLDDLTTGIAGIGSYSVSVRAQGFLSLSSANTAVSQRYWHNAGTTVTAYRYQASIRLLPVRVG